MNNKKRLNAIVLSGLLVLTLISPIFGSDEDYQNINLSNFQETIKVTDIGITRGRKSVAIKEYELKKVKDKVDELGSTDLETVLNRDYNVKEAVRVLKYENWLLDETEKAVVLDGTMNYFNYLLTADEIQLQKNKVARLKKELSQIETKISLGTAVQSAKVTKELEISNVEFAIKALEFDLASLELELNKSMFWDLSTTLEVFPLDIPVVDYTVSDLDLIIESVLENHGDMVDLNTKLELAEQYLEILYDEDYEDEDDEIIDAKDAITDVKLDLSEKRINLDYKVRSAYNALLNAKDELSIKVLELTNLEYSLDIVQKRYNVGLEIITSVDAAKEQVKFGEFALKQSRLAYYKQVETFKNLTTFVED